MELNKSVPTICQYEEVVSLPHTSTRLISSAQAQADSDCTHHLSEVELSTKSYEEQLRDRRDFFDRLSESTRVTGGDNITDACYLSWSHGSLAREQTTLRITTSNDDADLTVEGAHAHPPCDIIDMCDGDDTPRRRSMQPEEEGKDSELVNNESQDLNPRAILSDSIRSLQPQLLDRLGRCVTMRCESGGWCSAGGGGGADANEDWCSGGGEGLDVISREASNISFERTLTSISRSRIMTSTSESAGNVAFEPICSQHTTPSEALAVMLASDALDAYEEDRIYQTEKQKQKEEQQRLEAMYCSTETQRKQEAETTWARIFHGKLSLPLGVILLTASTLGGSLADMPWAFSQLGIISGSLVVFFTAFITDATYCMVASLIEETGLGTFQDIAQYFYGGRGKNIAFILITVLSVMVSAAQVAEFGYFLGHKGTVNGFDLPPFTRVVGPRKLRFHNQFTKREDLLYYEEKREYVEEDWGRLGKKTHQRWSNDTDIYEHNPLHFEVGDDDGIFRRWLGCRGQEECTFFNRDTLCALGVLIVIPFYCTRRIRSTRYAAVLSIMFLMLAILLFAAQYIEQGITQPYTDLSPAIHCAQEPFYCRKNGDPEAICHRSSGVCHCSRFFQGETCARKYRAWHHSVRFLGFGVGDDVIEATSYIAFSYTTPFIIYIIHDELESPEKLKKLIHISVYGLVFPILLLVGFFGYAEYGRNVRQSEFCRTDERVCEISAACLYTSALLKTPLWVNPLRELIRTSFHMYDERKRHLLLGVMLGISIFLLAAFTNHFDSHNSLQHAVNFMAFFLFPGFFYISAAQLSSGHGVKVKWNFWMKEKLKIQLRYFQGWLIVVTAFIFMGLSLSAQIVNLIEKREAADRYRI